MNGITEPLPGLLDDPQFQIADIPALTDFQIAPLRNPAPSRHANVPLPLEPLAGNILNSNTSHASNKPTSLDNNCGKRRPPNITPNDVFLAREAKKPHLAISELLEANDAQDIIPTQLPSFISLSVVERSPIQAPTSLNALYPHSQKRPRLDTDTDAISHDLIRRLPRPAQKDERNARPAPIIPAMVTGLHEPPPSAALLPSIDLTTRPGLTRSNTLSKMNVKDILTTSDQWLLPPSSNARPTVSAKPLESTIPVNGVSLDTDVNSPTTQSSQSMIELKDNKPRRVRRKWSEKETRDLLSGVQKYGIGKWKHILDDQAFSFCERSSVDLKDRYRVVANNETASKQQTKSRLLPLADDSPTKADGDGDRFPHGTTPSASETTPGLSCINSQPLKQRRKRRAWTGTEDDNLLKGISKHGFQWTNIHDDPELDLQHRRATDLRDRIRNKFPDGYKHADTAPLRSETKKAEKSNDTPTNTPLAVTDKDPQTSSSSSSLQPGATSTDLSSPPPPPKLPSLPTSAPMTNPINNDDEQNTTKTRGNQDKSRDRENLEKDRERDQQPVLGVTLPSFTLDVDDMDWQDNRLPPLHEWEDIGL